MLHGVNSKRQTGGVTSLLLLWVAGIALIYYICVMRDLPRVQSLLSGQVVSAVLGAGAANANVVLDGRDVILNGSVSDQEQKTAAGFAARGVYGVRHIRNELQVAPVATAPAELKSPEFSMQMSDDAIMLYGLVSSDNSSSLIAEGVQQSYPTYTVENNIEVDAETSDPVWLETTLSSLSILHLVNQPAIDITEDQIEIRGSVDSVEARDTVFQELGLLYGDTLTVTSEVEVVVPAKMLDPELNLVLVNDELTLSGQMHSSEELEKVASAAMGAFDLKLMNNELAVNSEVAQALWLEPALELLPQLGEFEALELNMTSDQATISGMVGSDEQRKAALKIVDSTIGTMLPVSDGITIKNAPVETQAEEVSAQETQAEAETETEDDTTETVENQSVPGAQKADTESASDSIAEKESIPGTVSEDQSIPGVKETESLVVTEAENIYDSAESIPGALPDDDMIPGGVVSNAISDSSETVTEGTEAVVDAATEAVADADTDEVVDAVKQAVADTDTDEVVDAVKQAVADTDTDEVVDAVEQAVADTDTDEVVDAVEQAAADTDTAEVVDAVEQAVADTDTDEVVDAVEQAAADADTDEVVDAVEQADADTDELVATAADAATETVADAASSTTENETTSDTTDDTTEADNTDSDATASAEQDNTADATEESASAAEVAPSSAETVKASRTALGEALNEVDVKDIRFEVNKSILTPESTKILTNVASVLTEFPSVDITVNGHTDSIGSDEANLSLSRSRAESVKDYLVSQGIEETRLKALGFGESDPIADNNTPAGRALNRRIEFNY